MPAGKIPKWKLQSMQFRQAVGAGSQSKATSGGYGGGMGGGYGSQAQLAQYEPPDDRIQCNYCGRRFNEQAHTRHVVHCEQKHKKE